MMNFDRLQQALYDHGLAAVPRIRAVRPNDSFYSFAFYTSGEYGYAFLTASSHEGLDEVVADYLSNPSYSHQNPVHLRTTLKWSPCDSPLHELCAEASQELDEVMTEVSEAFPDIDDKKTFDEFVRRVDGAFIGALRQLDSEGRFGSGQERAGIVLNLLMGDQSDEERIHFASQLNPPGIVAAFAEELAAICYD